jgi:hypothetical protein
MDINLRDINKIKSFRVIDNGIDVTGFMDRLCIILHKTPKRDGSFVTVSGIKDTDTTPEILTVHSENRDDIVIIQINIEGEVSNEQG